MTRALRIEFEGALYHVLSRGNERKRIFFDDEGRQSFLKVLEEYSKRFDIEVLCLCSYGQPLPFIGKNKQKAYREKVQNYSKRVSIMKTRLLEDAKTKKIISKTKSRIKM